LGLLVMAIAGPDSFVAADDGSLTRGNDTGKFVRELTNSGESRLDDVVSSVCLWGWS
jgi:hypothetical protein